MAFRECPNHGWLRTSEYTVCSKTGEIICPECGMAVTGYRSDSDTPPWYNRKRSSSHDFDGKPEQIYGAGNEKCVHEEQKA